LQAGDWFTVNVRPAIVIVPVRATPEFAATLKPTVPLPDPFAPLVTVIQLAPLAAVHGQPAVAVTVTEPVPPPAATVWLVGEIVGAVHVTDDWFTVNVRPAIVIVPVRAAPEFAATLKPTVPLPDPFAPLVTVIQVAPLAAVHGQPAVAVTVTEPVPPPAATVWLVGEIVGVVHPDDWNENVFDTVLAPTPPLPTALTRAS
jgi:hypothetical protein